MRCHVDVRRKFRTVAHERHLELFRAPFCIESLVAHIGGIDFRHGASREGFVGEPALEVVAGLFDVGRQRGSHRIGVAAEIAVDYGTAVRIERNGVGGIHFEVWHGIVRRN